MKMIPKNYREAIFESGDQLVTFPECAQLDIAELKNHRYDYRLRVGRYRILFDFADVVKIVYIQ